MLTYRLLFATMVFSPTSAAAAQPPPASDRAIVEYQAEPVIADGKLRALAFSMTFIGDGDGETELELPTSWAGSDQLYKHITRLTASGATIADPLPQPNMILRHAPDAQITVQWHVSSSATADPDANYEKANPVIRADWFYIHGNTAFIAPTGNTNRPARFTWGKTPSPWTVSSDIDFVGQRSLTVDKIAGSILIGGTDIRITEQRIGGVPIRLALRGKWAFSDRQLVDAMASAFEAYNGYLEVGPVPYFVSLIPLTGGQTGAISSGGSGRFGGFALAATTNTKLDDFVRLLAHEYGHRWFGGDFGPVAQPDGNEYWFTEGINDYVTSKALVISRLWSIEDYTHGLRETVLRYASSPARSLPYQSLIDAFWTNPDSAQAVYDRGHLHALIAAQSHPDKRRFADALQTMASRPRDFPETLTQGARFAQSFGDRGTLEFAADLQAGAPVTIPRDLLAACGAFEWHEQPVFDTGYTTSIKRGVRTITTVSPGHPARAAGLRPGMVYVKRMSVAFGDSTVPIVLRIADERGEQDLSWFPAGKATVRYQRLVLDPTKSRDDCRRVIIR